VAETFGADDGALVHSALLCLSRFFLHAAAETFHADDGAFVQAAHDDFVCIAGFDLESDLAVFDDDHLRAAMNRLGSSPHFVNSAF
jgi:hypothetical protein